MNIEEAIGVIRCDIDAKTGKQITHSEKYGRVIDFLGGLEAVARFIPFELSELVAAYKVDPCFNNLPLKAWDYQAGFNYYGANCDFLGTGIWALYRKHGITTASCSDGVCILKEAARRLVTNTK